MGNDLQNSKNENFLGMLGILKMKSQNFRGMLPSKFRKRKLPWNVGHSQNEKAKTSEECYPQNSENENFRGMLGT